MMNVLKNRSATFLTFILALWTTIGNAQITNRVVLGYFPSWSESWTSANQNSKLRQVPSFVNHLFLSFAKPNLSYTLGSYDIAGTGIEVPYDGCTLKESVAALKNKGIKVILSIGGETYWGSSDAYKINYQQIKDLVDDMGFAGIDWDFEPNGSFATIGNATNVQHFIDFISKSRALMPKSKGYIIACAPSGVGALGGSENNDLSSPFKYANRNSITGETDANLYQATVITNGISLFGFGATGHMIPVMQQVGDLIDLIAFQGYNCGASTNREIMYDSYAYYAEKHGFVIAAGVHYPNEPWGPYYQYTHKNVAALAGHIKNLPSRTDNNDGIMIWELLLENTVLKSSAFSYMHVASLVLGGSTETNAVQNALNYTSEPYKGGAQGCGTNNGGGSTSFCGVQAYKAANQYATPNTKVYYQCKIWYNKWYANSNEIPGSNQVWEVESNCSEELSCSPLSVSQSFIANVFSIFPNPATNYLQVSFVNENREWEIYNQQGLKVLSGKDPTINISMLSQGLYLIQSGESKKIFMKK